MSSPSTLRREQLRANTMGLTAKLYRFAEFIFAGLGGPTLWTISVSGYVVGSLTCEAGSSRLAWFDNADGRLRAYRGPVTDDVEALAEALSECLGAPVSLDSIIL